MTTSHDGDGLTGLTLRVHTVVRTPNGNDYGRDLLRQHHEQFDHARAGHQHR